MKNKLFIIFSVISLSIYAQPKIDELNIPSSPAFVLLDESPANIEKPTNPKALALSLINVWEGSGAMEFTPYWLYDHPNYYFDEDVKNHFPFFQTLAFSLATSEKDEVTSISGGFRVQLFRLYDNETDIINSIAPIENALANIPPDEAAIKSLAKQLAEKRSKIKWNVELAGAYSGESTSETKLSGNKLGFWLNIRHTPTDWPIDFVLLSRYSKVFGDNEALVPDSSFMDYGASISKQGDVFDLQLEYVFRRDTTLDLDYDRLAFIANYEVLPGVVAVASFGKNFDEFDEVFTALGIKFGLSRQKINATPTP